MSSITEKQVWNQISQKELTPIYLFYGEESFKVEDACRSVEKIFAKENSNYVRKVFYPDNLNLDDLKQSTQGLSLFQEAQFILIRGVDQLKAKVLDDLVDSISEIDPSTTQVILTAEGMDKRKKAVQKMLKGKEIVSVQFVYCREGEFKVWAKNLAKRRKRNLDYEGQTTLWEYVGPSLFELDMAIEKACLFAPEGKSLSAQQIKAVTVKTRQELVFAFTDAVSRGDKREALHSLHTLYQQGEEAIAIIALIAKQFQWMLQVTSLHSAGKDTQSAIAEMKIFPKLGKAIANAAKKRGVEKINKSLSEIQAADMALKSSPVRPKLVLEQLTVRLTSL